MMDNIILSKSGELAEHKWTVLPKYIESGGIDCAFVQWCRDNLIDHWRFAQEDSKWYLYTSCADNMIIELTYL